uniref:Solute carrier family 26 member 9 n=1 Tax=Astyanax mexicanus TaxID=7994 RepID=A0A8B9L7Y2_ASTMX
CPYGTLCGRLKSLLFRHFPVLSWLPKYNFRQNLLTDVISGVSAGTIQVPQGMAFALLASLPPVNGLYSSFFPLIPYFFMGTAHQMVPGTFAVLSIMVGMVCLRLAPESHFSSFNHTTNKTVVDEQQMNEVRLGISATLACLTAIIQIGLGMMQFGFVAIYLSESFVRGFMTAAGLQILISVLKYIFGIHVPPYSGPLAIIYTLIDICRFLPETNIASLVFALVSAVVLIIVKELGARYRHKIPFPIPIEIIVVSKIDMDMIGINFLGGFFKIHVICCALSVTLAVDSAGGSSQVSLCVMLVVMVTMLALGAYLKPLPKSVLGALIAVNLKNTLLQLSDPYYLWKKNKLDCVSYSVFTTVQITPNIKAFFPFYRNGSEVAQVMETDVYKNPKVYNKAVEGVKIVSYCSPLYFANVEIFRRKVIKKTGLDPGKVLLTRRKFLKKQQEKEKQEIKTISQIDLQSDFYTVSADMPTSYVNPYCDITSSTDPAPDPEPTSPPAVTIEMQPMPFHTLILDLAGVCFIDLMGIKVLTKMSNTYSALGISMYLANVQAQVYEELEVGGLFNESSVTPGHLFLSVHDAVLFAQSKSLSPGTAEEEVNHKDRAVCFFFSDLFITSYHSEQ